MFSLSSLFTVSGDKRGWLRHCAPQWEVMGSIPSRALGNLYITYSIHSHSVGLGSTQPLTEMTTKEFPWG
jgi:hypothetical protein